MSPSTAPPVLDLDAELLELDVKLGGVPYKLRNRSELSILELHNFSALLHRYDDLTDIEAGDEENAAKIGAALQEIAATLVVAPPDGGFSDQQCAAILAFWTSQHGQSDPPPERPLRAPQDRLPKHPTKRKARSTGAK